MSIPPTCAWILIGLISVIGSIGIGLLISKLIHPILVDRYLYPVSTVAWLLFSYSVYNWFKDKRLKNVMLVLVVSFLLAVTIPPTLDTYDQEKYDQQKTDEALATLSGISDEDMILTDIYQFQWTMLDYYFPDIENYSLYDVDIGNMDPNREYYFLLEDVIDNKLREQLEHQGFSCTKLSEKMNISGYYFYAYHAQR